MKKIDLRSLIKLVFICSLFMIAAGPLGYFISSVIVYFKIGIFIFNWHEFLYGSLRQGIAGGAVFGIGLWIKDKLLEKQEQKNQDP
ncbi:hypothetical protein [Aeromonas sp.]|uniref:hypothetical protein n=1 Tax=Aeromonas sp. TaxID=647 RepID=UPI003F3979D2